MSSSLRATRTGYTLVEVVLVTVIIGLISLIGLRQLQLYLDRVATRDAVRAAGDLVARARDEAVAQRTVVSLRIDTLSASLALSARGHSFASTPLGQTQGVALSTTRDSIAFDLRGLGYGAANLTLVAHRGHSADTLIVSRLGRVRY